MSTNTRIARNTLLLYFRMFLLIIVQLYTVPIILRALGASDYGLYYAVGGIAAMFSFIGGSLSSGSQRFLAYALGKRDIKLLKRTFDTTVSTYIVFAIISFFVLEIGGIWFLNYQMNIPADRLIAANWCYQFSIFAFVVNLMVIPYMATVIVHERMSLFAYLSILECVLKLSVAIALQYILKDKLIVYAILIFVIAGLVQAVYWLYCRFQFAECKNYSFSWSSKTGKELYIYSGWNAVGSLAIISRQHGLNVLINLFFGTILNAAHSIAQQIYGVLTQFVNNLYVATRPQITKFYATGDTVEMWNLVFRSARLAFYLLMLISIPLIIEMNTILKLWLGEVPQYTVEISILMIISMLIETQVNQIIAAFQAANRIKRYQLYSSTILLCNIPVTYWLLRILGDVPLLPYFVSILLSVLYAASILWQAKVEIQLDLKKYIKQVIIKLCVVFGVVFFCIYSVSTLMSPSLYRVVCTCLLSVFLIPFIVWLIGLDDVEKAFCVRLLRNKIHL